MLQSRNIKKRINKVLQTTSGSGGVGVCPEPTGRGDDDDIRPNTRGVSGFDTRRRQNRLGRSLWDSKTGGRSVYGERILKKKDKGLNKKGNRHQQGEHEDTRTQIKRNKEEYKQQGNGKSLFRQYIRKFRRKHLRGQQYITPNTRQRVYIQYKYPKSVFDGPNEDSFIANGIRCAKNELWSGLREVKRERNIKQTKYKRVSLIRKSIPNKERCNRQVNSGGGTRSSN